MYFIAGYKCRGGMGVEGFEGVPLVACEPGRITASRLLLTAVWSPQSSFLSWARCAEHQKKQDIGRDPATALLLNCRWAKYLEGCRLEDERWRHSLGDQTRIWGDKDFPVPKDWESSCKALTEAAKVVETGSQGGVKGVKVLPLLQLTVGCIVCYLWETGEALEPI